MHRIFLNFATSYPAYQNSVIKKKFTVPFLKYKLAIKAEIKGVLSRS